MLKDLRKRNNLTQAQVAKEIGVAESTICLYEKGERTPAVEKILKLAQIYNCSVEEIVNCFKEK